MIQCKLTVILYKTYALNVSGGGAPNKRVKKTYSWTKPRGSSPDYNPPSPKRTARASTPPRKSPECPPGPSNSPSYKPNFGPRTPPGSPQYIISAPNSPPNTEVTPKTRAPIPSAEQPSKRKKIYSLKRRLMDGFTVSDLNERRAFFTNMIYPTPLAVVEQINTNMTSIPQITRDMGKVNQEGMSTLKNSCPQIILSNNIIKTYQLSHVSNFSRGTAKSCTWDLVTDQLTVYEAQTTSYAITQGLYVPTMVYSQGANLVRLANTSCPHSWVPSLKHIHQDRSIVSVTLNNFKFQVLEPPKRYPLTPEGEMCGLWHHANREVLSTIPNFSTKYLEKMTNRYLILPSMPLINHTVPAKRHLLMQMSTYSRAYRLPEILQTIRTLTETNEETVYRLYLSSSITFRELLNCMPQGACCLILPSRIAYKITLAEISRLIIIAHSKE